MRREDRAKPAIGKGAKRWAWVLATVAALALSGCATLGIGRPRPVTVAQVVAMSRAGEPADAIVAKMRDSGTVYRLSASQLAELRDRGVPDAVIDYMQGTYLAAVQRRQELQDWDSWTGVDGYWYGGLPYGWPDDWLGDVDVSPPVDRDHDRD
jgi:hypothetical protein